MRCVSLFACLVAVAVLHPHPSGAQVASDGTLNTSVSTVGTAATITNGTAAGSNLFHSFGQFSIPTGGSATFDLVNTPNISTIFSRVTGGSVSNIDGLIRTTNSSNPVSLFLVNPAGILFGPNARLDIGGSFVGTTANSIQFADGTEFSAVNPTATPLLTVSVPIGLQMGNNPAPIVNQSIVNGRRGLEVASGQNVLFIGGEIELQGGRLRAPGGRVEVVSVAGEGTVQLNPGATAWQLSVPDNLPLGNFTASEAGGIYVRGQGGGEIVLRAQNALFTGGGFLRAGMDPGASSVDVRSGNVTITVPGSVTLGTDALILNTVIAGAIGTSGDVTIKTGALSLRDGGQISLGVAGVGTGGNVNIQANTISSTGFSPTRPTFSSGIFNRIFAGGAGRSGDINLRAETISLSAGSQINALIDEQGEGRSGDINLIAKRIEIDAANSYRTAGTAIVNALEADAQGESGNLNIFTDTLKITNGGQLITNLRGQGSPGTINIQAQDVVVDGGRTVALAATETEIFTSGILSSAESNSFSFTGRIANRAVGQAGKINLTTRTLTLSRGGNLTTNTSGDGNAGNVNLKAERIRIDGEFEGNQSGIYSTVEQDGVGNGGTIQIAANDLTLTNGAIITANTSGQGNAGAIQISAPNTTLQNSSISSESLSQGNGGTISLTAQNLTLDDRASLSTAASAGGRAGNLNLQAQRTTLLNHSQITTRSTGGGDGGTVSLTGDTLTLRNGALVNASTALSDGGNLKLNLSELLYLRDRSQLTAEAGGMGNGGNININTLFVVGVGNSDIIANAFQGNGGNIQIVTQGIYGLKFRPQLTPKNDITASSQFGLNGTVVITDPAIDPTAGLVTLPDSLVDPSRQIATGCESNRDSRFVVTGRGGLSQNPIQETRYDRPWNDLRDPAAYRSQPTPTVPIAQAQSSIVEASVLKQTNGQLELVAINSPVPLPQTATCAGAIVPAL